MRHCIETLRWDLSHPSAHAALAGTPLQHRLTRFLKTEGLRRIEAQFDRHGRPDEVWRIDCLELDLGRLSGREDETQWGQRLDEALDLALWRARQHSQSGGPPQLDPSGHALDQFLFYLLHGHLPWGMSLPGRRAVSPWLARLAQSQGPRLWNALQQHPQRESMRERLAQVSPHEGLQALLAARDAPLAATLQWLDDACLTPLQAGGRLGAYQRAQLQQALRVAGLHAWWGARGSTLGAGRRARLLQALRTSLAHHLGTGWAGLLGAVPALGSAPAPSARLLQDLLSPRSAALPLHADAQTSGPEQPTRTWEAGLQQLRSALTSPRRHSAAQSERLARLLQRLAATHPTALRQRLLAWASERRQRRQWSLCLAPDSLGALLAAMGQGPQAAEALLRPGSAAWSDSLRQTALRLQRDAPVARRPSLGRLQALLMEACLQRLASGQRLPDSHSAWQAMWQQAWQQWLGDGEACAASGPGPVLGPANGPEVRWGPPPPAAPIPAPAGPVASPPMPLDQALVALERQCREGRWAWPQRLRLARLLETESACERWLSLFDESRRWRMLRAQFGPLMHQVQRRAGRLQQWLGGWLSEPLARAKEHWRRLCRFLFVQGLSPEPAALRQHYQAEPSTAEARPSPRVPPLPSGQEPIWVGDAGQVLLAAYLERLFRQQGLWREGRFVDITAQARAVQCLQVLCRGPGVVDEALVALSRLLCGLHPSELLPELPPLPTETADLLEQLLQAVIQHWAALGHTSVAGLRESFLQREGRLQRDKTAEGEPPRWRLRVQGRGFDVLLDRLPWNYRTIRLPWMQGVLHVEWR